MSAWRFRVGLKQPDDRADGAVDGAVAPFIPSTLIPRSTSNVRTASSISQACRKDRVAGWARRFSRRLWVYGNLSLCMAAGWLLPQPYRFISECIYSMSAGMSVPDAPEQADRVIDGRSDLEPGFPVGKVKLVANGVELHVVVRVEHLCRIVLRGPEREVFRRRVKQVQLIPDEADSSVQKSLAGPARQPGRQPGVFLCKCRVEVRAARHGS